MLALLGARTDASARRAGARPRPRAIARRRRRSSPEDAAELERRRATAPRRRHRAAARRPGPRRRPGRRLAPAQAVLGAPAVAAPRSSAPAREILEHDEDRVLLDSAVKGADGFFTTFFVSPYSKYIARWAARRGLTPNQVTTISMLIGVAGRRRVRHRRAPGAGRRRGAAAGRVRRSTASTASSPATRASSPSSAPGWTRSSTARRSTSCSPGLAIGASRTGDPVWLLAGAALTLQTARHAIDFSFPPRSTRSSPRRRSRRSRTRSTGRARPRGSRSRSTRRRRTRCRRRRRPRPGAGHACAGGSRPVAGASTAARRCAGSRRSSPSRSASASPRSRSPPRCAPRTTTFIVLLVWGGFAAAYVLSAGLRSLAA